MRRALVTGHLGFVGRHMTQALKARGFTVTGVDVARDAKGDVRRAMRAGQDRAWPVYDLVVHCAAIVGGRSTIEQEPLKVATDLAIDADFFQWAVRTGQQRVVYYSSSAVYPTHLQTRLRAERLTEDRLDLDQLMGNPDLSYGWAKLSGEMLARWASQEGVRVHVFRPFSGYGPDQDPAYPFRAFLDRARAREDPFRVWGTGRQVRDFIHIDDVIETTLAAVEQDYPGPLNLCTGVPTPFRLLAFRFTRAAGYEPTIETVPDAPVGVAYRVGDPTNMNTVRPARIDLQRGVAEALREYK